MGEKKDVIVIKRKVPGEKEQEVSIEEAILDKCEPIHPLVVVVED
jgi:hypothetical protein